MRAIISAILKEYGKKIISEINMFLDKYKDLIVKELKKDGAVIITEAKKFLTSALNEIVKAITDLIKHLITEDELYNDEQALKDPTKISDWFKKVWAKIKEAFKGLDKDFKKFEDLCYHFVEKFLKDTKEMRAIISAILKEYGKKIISEINMFLDKYKDLIVKELKKDGAVIITEAKKFLTSALNEIVKAITDLIKHLITEDELYNDVKNEMVFNPNSFWDKIIDTVKKIKGVIKESTMRTLIKYKPQILDAVKNLKDVIIACGKDIVIQVSHGIIKIITDGTSVMSDGSNPGNFYFKGEYDMIVLPEIAA